jgi:branched-chain amino acid transport system substrate-binding protein
VEFVEGVATKTLAIVLAVVVVLVAIGIGLYYMTAPPAPTPTTPTTPPTTPTTPPTTPTTTTPTPPKVKEVVIGLIEPLTGKYAVFGQEARQAAELIVDIINNELGGIKSMGGAKLKLVVVDAGGSPDEARIAAEKLISENHPNIVLGAYISRMTAAVAEVTEREKTILVMDALVDDLTERGWQYVFRAAPKASMHGASAVDFVLDSAKKAGVEVKRVVILNEDSVFGTYVSNGAHMEAIKKGIEVANHISYPYDIADFSSILDTIKRSNPDFIVMVPYFSDGVLFAKQFAESGMKVKFIAGAGGCGFTDPDSIKAAGEAVLYYTNTYSFNPYRNTEWTKKVVSMFQQRYGKLPTEAGGIIFYSLFVVYEALEKAGQMFPDNPLNPDNLRQAFLSLDLNDSNSIAAQLYPSGRIKFAPNGDNLYALAVVLQVQKINGTLTPVLVWPEPQPGVSVVFPRP